MRFVAAFIVCFFLASPSGEASRIICQYSNLEPVEWVLKHFEWADVVFLGTVTATEGPSLTYAELLEANRTEESPTEAASMADLLERIETANQLDTQGLYQTATFAVAKLWKGATVTSIEVNNNGIPGMYGFHLLKDESYLIFGHRLENGFYGVSTVCGNTTRAENAAERITILDELTAAP